MKIYDDALMFPDGNAKPQGTPDEILAAGREMFGEDEGGLVGGEVGAVAAGGLALLAEYVQQLAVIEEVDELLCLRAEGVVHLTAAQGKAMGYENFIPLGYDRLGRNCWGPKECAAFRDQIVKDLVPIVARVKEDQTRRIGGHSTVAEA